MTISRNTAALLILTALTFAGCGDAGDGLVKQPVHGLVLVNGKPYRGVVLTLQHVDSSVKGNAARPVAVTNDEGRYELSTNGEKDGAVAGEYIVTFRWFDGSDSQKDYLDGKYTDRDSSKFRINVGESTVEVPPFELEAKEASVARAVERLAQTKLPQIQKP